MKGKKSRLLNRGNIAAVLIALIIFIGAYYFVNSQPKTYNINGIIIKSRGALKSSINDVLSKKTIVVEEDLFNSRDTRNSAVGAAAVEVILALKTAGKKVSVYGKIDNGGEYSYTNCNKSNDNCSNPNVIVKTGGENLMKVFDKIVIEGSAEYLLNNRVKFRGILLSAITTPQNVENRTIVEVPINVTPTALANASTSNATNESNESIIKKIGEEILSNSNQTNST